MANAHALEENRWATVGMLPLPSRSHPQKQNRAVYTTELTHLDLSVSMVFALMIALGERLHLAAIAVHAGRHPTLPLTLHRIINVNRLAIEKHLAIIGLRHRL